MNEAGFNFITLTSKRKMRVNFEFGGGVGKQNESRKREREREKREVVKLENEGNLQSQYCRLSRYCFPANKHLSRCSSSSYFVALLEKRTFDFVVRR